MILGSSPEARYRRILPAAPLVDHTQAERSRSGWRRVPAFAYQSLRMRRQRRKRQQVEAVVQQHRFQDLGAAAADELEISPGNLEAADVAHASHAEHRLFEVRQPARSVALFATCATAGGRRGACPGAAWSTPPAARAASRRATPSRGRRTSARCTSPAPHRRPGNRSGRAAGRVLLRTRATGTASCGNRLAPIRRRRQGRPPCLPHRSAPWSRGRSTRGGWEWHRRPPLSSADARRACRAFRRGEPRHIHPHARVRDDGRPRRGVRRRHRGREACDRHAPRAIPAHSRQGVSAGDRQGVPRRRRARRSAHDGRPTPHAAQRRLARPARDQRHRTRCRGRCHEDARSRMTPSLERHLVGR